MSKKFYTALKTYLSNRFLIMRSESEQLRYLPQSVKLEESVNPHIIRATMLLISFAVFVFISWASVTNINEVTKAQGAIVPKGFVQVVQHLDGGIITDIYANEGELVKAGQLLLRVDDGMAKQDLAKASTQQQFLQIEAEGLRAFIKNETPDFHRFLNTGTTNQIKNINRNNSIVDNNVMQELYDRVKKSKESLNIAKDSLKVKEGLYKKGLTTKLTLLKYRKQVNDIEVQALSELNNIKTQLAQNNENVSKLKNKVERFEVRSPVYGLVKGLAINTVGGVIKPGQTLMEIVPLDKNLVVEARISPNEIGHLKIGQTVRVKVSSYDFSRYGSLKGTLEFLSATTFLDEKGKSYYRGRISISQNYIGKDPSKNIIMPGMTVEADIITGKKTILAYLLKPIHRSLKTAFTER